MVDQTLDENLEYLKGFAYYQKKKVSFTACMLIFLNLHDNVIREVQSVKTVKAL